MTTTVATPERAPVPQPTVLVLGGTGRTGRLVVEQLLMRGARVRVIVRSAGRLPSACAADPRLDVIEADILSLGDAELRQQVEGCDAVVSCLGHPKNARGILGPPFDLVTRVTERVHAAALALRPASPLRFVLMSSVSVNHPGGADPRRGLVEGAALRFLRALVPPATTTREPPTSSSVKSAPLARPWSGSPSGRTRCSTKTSRRAPRTSRSTGRSSRACSDRGARAGPTWRASCAIWSATLRCGGGGGASCPISSTRWRRLVPQDLPPRVERLSIGAA